MKGFPHYICNVATKADASVLMNLLFDDVATDSSAFETQNRRHFTSRPMKRDKGVEEHLIIDDIIACHAILCYLYGISTADRGSRSKSARESAH
jgi:hypothetical protein